MQSLQIKNTNPVCENFLGNGAIYHCFAEMPDFLNRQYTPELAEIEAERAGKMRLKIARTFYGWYAWDEEKKEWDWESARCQALYHWLARMKKNGVAVALNTGWCCPGDINSTSWNGKSPFTVEDDWDQSVQNYADWVSESIHQLVELRGFDNIKILTLFTEPQHPSGSYSQAQVEAYNGDYWQIQMNAWKQCVDTVAETLARDGHRDKVLLMGPNEGSTMTSPMVKWVMEHPTDLDIYSSHAYQFSKDLPSIEGKTGKNSVVSVGISIAGGRFSQKVALQKNTEYEVRVHARVELKDSQTVSGNVVFGAFQDDGNLISAGSEPTSRLEIGSTALIDPAFMTKEFEWYSMTFNSAAHEKAQIGVFGDIKQEGHWLVVEQMQLIDKNTGENILKDHDFTGDSGVWELAYSGNSSDAYYDWRRWCKNGLRYVPKDKMFIYDEYNCTFDRDNARVDHGSNIVNAALAYMNCGANGSLLWTVFDQQWPNNRTTNNDSFVDGDHRCGVAPVLTRSLTPHRSYYAFSLLSRYTGGEGSKVYEGIGSQNIQTTMNVMPDGHVTIVVVNNKAAADSFTINFEKPLNLKLNRHAFNPATCVPDEKAEMIGTDGVVEANDTLTDEIGAYSVTVYTTYQD